MIQRKQTLWLLLSTVAALLCFMFPFATGKGMIKGVETDLSLKSDSNFILLLCTGASLVLSAVIIFLYKDRKQQMRLCLLGLLLSALIIFLFISQVGKMTKSTLALSCVLPFAVAAGYFLAFRNIRMDEKLVKSLDKLR
jgi:drug/metabolite transporter (DMT)-like permease